MLAAPVVPPSTLDRLSHECDDAVVLAAPEPFFAVGMFYQNFEQVSDEDVTRLLRAANQLRRVA